MFIFTFDYHSPLHPENALKKFSSFMYLVSIYSIFVSQEIFKVNYNANLKLSKTSQEKTKYRP